MKISKTLIKIWNKIDKKRKFQFIFLILFSNIVSIFEVISIGAVIPFITILINPDKIFEFKILFDYINFLKNFDKNEMQIFFTIIFCLSAIISGFFRLTLLMLQTKLSFNLGVDFSIALFKSTLYQPYKIHISRNSSEIHSGVRKVESLVSYLFAPVCALIGNFIMSFTIIIMLFAVNSLISFLIISFFTVTYLGIMKLTRHQINYNSSIIASKTTELTKSIQEGLGAIRNIIIENTQDTFLNNFKNAIIPFKKASALNVVISNAPKYIIESLGIVFLATIGFFIISNSTNFLNLIPLFAAYVLGIQKIMPMAQQVYSAIIDIKSGWESVKDLVGLIEKENYLNEKTNVSSKLKFENKIILKDIYFKYPTESNYVLKKVNLTIKKGDCIGVVGKTGSGKSTLIDIIIGLLHPERGYIKIDNVCLNTYKDVSMWQKNISHVPQSIFLTDTTFNENIAFGSSINKINLKKIIFSSKLASIHKTIISKANKYKTIVGERGGKISGGQRQRIGLARAFYNTTDLLILDEATSALDNATETKIIENLIKNYPNVTIIMIAHRISSLKFCNKIIEISNGKLLTKRFSQLK